MQARKYLRTHLVLTFMCILYAGSARAIESGASDFNGSRLFAHSKRIQELVIEGPLQCKVEGINNGGACRLTLTDEKTGQVYELAHTRELMDKVSSGRARVRIKAANDAGEPSEIVQVD